MTTVSIWFTLTQILKNINIEIKKKKDLPVSKTWNTCNFDCLQIFNIQNNWIIDINSWMVISLFLPIIWLYALKTAKSICPLTLFWLIPSDWSHLVNGQHLSLKNRLNLNSFEFIEFLSSRNTYSYQPLWGVIFYFVSF